MAGNDYEVKVMVGRKPKTLALAAASEAEARKIGSRTGQVLSIKKKGGGGARSFDRMSLADRMIFFQRLGAMLASRVGTSEALDIMYQSFTGHIKDAARILKDRIQAGATLPDAMEFAGPKYFPTAVVAIVKTGARGGDMAYAVKEAGRFEKELDDVRRSAKKGVGSAAFGFLAGVGTIMGSHFYVAPQIMESSLVKLAGDSLDIGWVMTMSATITWLAVFLLFLVGLVFFITVVLHPIAPEAIDRAIQKVPFYRDLALAKNNYMVFFGLAVLLKAGLRVEEAMRLTMDTAPRGELKQDLGRALEAIVKGSNEPWPNKMRMLHPTDRAALSTAQDRAQVASTIHELALQYQSIYNSRLELFAPIAQMVSAVFLSLAGFVLFAVSTIPLLQTMGSILTML